MYHFCYDGDKLYDNILSMDGFSEMQLQSNRLLSIVKYIVYCALLIVDGFDFISVLERTIICK